MNFIAYRSSKVSDCIFEIHQLWQSGFSRVYSNCCCRCSFEAEIIKIGQSSYKMYSNNILYFQESTTILNACTKIVWKRIECNTHIYICVCVINLFPFLMSASSSIVSYIKKDNATQKKCWYFFSYNTFINIEVTVALWLTYWTVTL